MKRDRLIAAFVILNGAIYLLLLLSEWLAPGAARMNANIIGSIGAGCCAIFGATLIRTTSRK
jgi:hypothetical protein